MADPPALFLGALVLTGCVPAEPMRAKLAMTLPAVAVRGTSAGG